MIEIKSKMLLAFFSIICLICIQPVLAEQSYIIEFEAKASGTFFVTFGIPGPAGEVSLVAVGEATECKIIGEATVTLNIDGQYLDFPAEMTLNGEIKGEIHPAKMTPKKFVVHKKTYSMKLEFWNLENAGGVFYPVIDRFEIEGTPPGGNGDPPPPCLGYELELEKKKGNGMGKGCCEFFSERHREGEAYGMKAGFIEGFDGIIIGLDVGGGFYMIMFDDNIEVHTDGLFYTDVDVEVKLAT